MVSSLAMDSFNAKIGQRLCLFQKELMTLVKSCFISYIRFFNKGKGLCFLKTQSMTSVKTCFISYIQSTSSMKVHEFAY